MNSFVYNVPVKVYFGPNRLEKNLGRELSGFGKKVLLVYGGGSIKKSGLYDEILKEIKDYNLELFELSGIDPNPKIESVREGGKICKANDIDVILAAGGGSTIDASKFIAAAACADNDPWEFLKGKPIEKALPIVTILTLAATGSEMDNVGVISNMEINEKLAGSSEHILPKVSFLDPTRTFSVSKYQTACGSADIMSHIFEIYFTMQDGMYMLDCFMEGLIKTIMKYAPIALKEPDNYEARANLMWASSWAINGFINGGVEQDWACHAIEHELSAFYDITHGLGLAIITPKWMEYCLDNKTIKRYVQYGVNVFGIDPTLPPVEIAEKAIDKTKKFLYEDLGLSSRLSEIDIDDRYFDRMADKACNGGIIHSFTDLNRDDVYEILKKSL